MGIRWLKQHEIDIDKWDHCIGRSCNELPYAYSWYLNTVSPHWDALVMDDYKAVMPLTRRVRWGYPYLFQPPFTQQLGVFSIKPVASELVSDFLETVKQRFSLAEISLNKHNFVDGNKFPVVINKNFELSLVPDYQTLYSSYSKNQKANLRKGRKHELQMGDALSPSEVIRMFRLNRGKGLATLSEADYLKLEQLVYKMGKRGIVRIYGAYTPRSNLCAGAIFITTAQRLIFLFSSLNDEGRQTGAMPWLIDQVIQANAGKSLILDFEGSNDPGIARFYKGFGALETHYPAIRINRLPWVVDWGRKLLKIISK